jgi:hypothetical protein
VSNEGLFYAAPNLRQPTDHFAQSSTERLLARRDDHVSVAPTCCAEMRTQMSDIITAVIALLGVAFAITLGVLLTDLWPWLRKRPDIPQGRDDA